MKTRLIAAAALGAMTLTGTVALAQNAPPAPAPSPGHSTIRADADRNGVVTRAELLAQVEQRFAQRDANSDGQLTEGESFHNRRGGRLRERILSRIDADGNGAITLAEQKAQAERRFARLDANGDGAIDPAEREAARERMRQMRERRGDPIARADTDRNGILTRAEMLAQVEQRFAQRDANSDGQLTGDERLHNRRGAHDGRRMGEHERGGERSARFRERRMNRIDADGNGAISLAEQKAQAERRFARLDSNGDGAIDQAERDAVRERMEQMRERRGDRQAGAVPPAE
ncbi:EF-hand domain-containing protein [Sphingosinithalassobacter sp. LHW66-3]|uniref:EF-hand domain-containing protein n=1 Tax=Sphingosinithalassobacter sp. LHW66-3 TaxID=3424718 RepID=UPI003D6A15B9